MGPKHGPKGFAPTMAWTLRYRLRLPTSRTVGTENARLPEPARSGHAQPTSRGPASPAATEIPGEDPNARAHATLVSY